MKVYPNCVCCGSKIMDGDFRVKCVRCEQSMCESCINDGGCLQIGPCAERRLQVVPPAVKNPVRLKDVVIGGTLTGLMALGGFFIFQPSPIIIQPAEVVSFDDSRVTHLSVKQAEVVSELKFSVPVIFMDGAPAEIFIALKYRTRFMLYLSQKQALDMRIIDLAKDAIWSSCRGLESTAELYFKRTRLFFDIGMNFPELIDLCTLDIPLIKYSVREDLPITERPRVTTRVDETAEADLERFLKNRS